ncbi:M48 family metallopeptidase [Zafaria sp. Z1313]|uniref:M48 metallopeptidase family protein n=1 Tax=unclassified Zafaria TaxID=2828765 RepID=UPI002E78A85D|nr:M48 family metallopeptidase [Zafaria sp. J156]MEE1620347.1 M48 family metallopeptidase [Zafaria sp. J156]
MPLQPGERVLVLDDGLRVRVVRSARRRKTVSAAWKGAEAVVSVPAHLSRAQEEHWIEEMVGRLKAGRDRRRGRASGRNDEELMRRAARLSAELLEGRARPLSVRWVTNQNSRWGSATPADGTIRISHRLQEIPDWVLDYVLHHELAHLVAPGGHGPAFRTLEKRYPRLAEAKAFLAGVGFGTRLAAGGGPADSGADPLDGGDPDDGGAGPLA